MAKGGDDDSPGASLKDTLDAPFWSNHPHDQSCLSFFRKTSVLSPAANTFFHNLVINQVQCNAHFKVLVIISSEKVRQFN